MMALRSKFNGERGSAMTEFVIGLPIFIMIFAGMGSIYRLNHEGISAKLEANRELWAAANPGALNAAAMVPIVGTATGVSDWGDLAVDGAGALGIYADSYVKTWIPLTAAGFAGETRPAEGCFTLGCDLIDMPSNYFAYPLLNDNSVTGITTGLDFSGWAAGITSVLDVLGARPAMAAGIRYGSLVSPSVERTVSLPVGTYSMETGDLRLPAVTVPTHRVIAVGLTRLEFGTSEVWHKHIPHFDDNWGGQGAEPAEGGDSCSAQAAGAAEIESCHQNPPINPETGQPDSSLCGGEDDIAGGDSCGGSSPLFDLAAGWCTAGTPGC